MNDLTHRFIVYLAAQDMIEGGYFHHAAVRQALAVAADAVRCDHTVLALVGKIGLYKWGKMW